MVVHLSWPIFNLETILGLVWGGKGQQSLIKNSFAELMLFNPPLSKNWFKPQISGEQGGWNLQIKRLRATCSLSILICAHLGPERKQGLSIATHGDLLTKLSPR